MGRDKNPQEPASQNWAQVQQRARTRILIWVVAALYLCYLGYQLLKGYLRGDSDLSLGVLVVVLVIFAAAVVGIGILAVRQWKQSEERVARMIEEENRREEAELERQARLDALSGRASAVSDDDDGDETDGEDGEAP